jgi:phage head maturation protease
MDRRLEVRNFPDRLHFRDGGDGRTVFGRVVPFGVTTEFEDHDGSMKKERFVRGALTQAAKAWNRVILYYSHADILPNRLGRGLELEQREDGGYATFYLDAFNVEQAREVLSGSHQGLSLGFYPDITRPDPQGVLDRIKVSVDHVGAVPEAAYDTAKVLAIRGASDDTDSSRIMAPRLAEALRDLAQLKESPEVRAVRESLR